MVSKESALESQVPSECGSCNSSTTTLAAIPSTNEKGFATSQEPVPLSPLRQGFILATLSLAQFFDVFNACAVMVSIPLLAEDLNFSPGTSQWVLSGYTLTFAAFMLVAGRISDIYHPKPVFTAGFLLVGLLSIPIAASVNPIMLIVFRALQGIGAALNVPAALSLISIHFPDPATKGRAFAIYGAAGAVGNVLGLVIGGILTARVSWRWVFYLLAIVVTPIAVASWFILPPHQRPEEGRNRKIDWPGVIALTAGLILFVFAITEGSAGGWGSTRVIVTLVLSIVILAAFMGIEFIVNDPAFPPRTWTNKNFTPLFFYAWSIYWFFFVVELQSVEIFTTLWGYDYLSAAVHCLPFGIAAGISSYTVGIIAPKVPKRLLLLSGQVLMAVGVILIALANKPGTYWSRVVPGMIVGTIGLAIAYVGCTTVVMEGARPGEEGIVGAMVYTAYQIGATVGLAIAASITIAVNKNQPLDSLSQQKGFEMSYWSLLAMHGIMIIVSLFVRD